VTHLSTNDLPPFVDPEICGGFFFEGEKPDGKCPTGNPQIRNLTYVVGGVSPTHLKNYALQSNWIMKLQESG